MYEIMRDMGRVGGIRRIADNAFIPRDVKNGDFIAFLEWNEKQSEPLDLSDKEPEPPRVVPEDELEFTPEERKRLRALLAVK